jgi:hypothetical protein
VMNTGIFESRISRLLDPGEERWCYLAIQYSCEMDAYNHYVSAFTPRLRDEFNTKYKDKFVAFRTLMEVVG